MEARCCCATYYTASRTGRKLPIMRSFLIFFYTQEGRMVFRHEQRSHRRISRHPSRQTITGIHC